MGRPPQEKTVNTVAEGSLPPKRTVSGEQPSMESSASVYEEVEFSGSSFCKNLQKGGRE
jgi:hypothetical protein